LCVSVETRKKKDKKIRPEQTIFILCLTLCRVREMLYISEISNTFPE